MRIRVACPHTHNVIATIEDGQAVRWRCRDRFCPDVIEARARGNGERIFHRFDLVTDEITTERLPPIGGERPEAA